MSNGINLDPASVAPAIQGLAGQPLSQGDGAALFSAILMQQMNGAGMDPATDPTSGDNFSLPFSVDPGLVKLLPAVLSRGKDGKYVLPENDDLQQVLSGPEQASPALSMWIASMLAAQQPKTPETTPVQNTGSGQATQPPASDTQLPAIEQLVPAVSSATKNGHLSAEPTIGRQVVDRMVERVVDRNAPGLAKAGKDGGKKEPTQEFIDILHVAVPQPADKVDPSKSPAHVANNDPTDPVVSSAAPSVKDIHADPAIAITKDSQPELNQVQTAPAGQNTDTNSGHSEQSRSGSNDSKKDSAPVEQLQAMADAAKSTVSAVVAAAQPAITDAQSGHAGSIAPVANHASVSSTIEPLSLREAGSPVAAAPAPRIVHAARLMEAAGQAELHVAMKTDTAGTVDVRAMLQGDHVSATVAAQHGGTRDWMMANLHELQSSLSRDELNLRTFEVTDSALQNDGRGGRSQHQDQPHGRGQYSQAPAETTAAPTRLEDIDLHENATQAVSLLA